MTFVQNLDQINAIFAQALGQSASQLDFIINGDIKCRMRQGSSDD